MPRIAFDARMWSHPGIGRYIRELSGRLHVALPKEEFTFLGYDRDLTGLPYRALNSKIYSMAEQFEVPSVAAGFDLLHVPHFNSPFFFSKKMVVTVHDLIYLHDPKASRSPLGRLYAKAMIARALERAAAVITVSEFTKKDMLETFPSVSPEKIFVTPEAASSRFRPLNDYALVASTLRKHRIRQPYVFFVGSLKKHKNVAVLIKAMRRLFEAQKVPHRLVIAGKADPKEKALLAEIKSARFIDYIGEVTDPELVELYNGADVFVLPSLREGFGLPVLEAMACGCPVICSNAASLPEVAGDAARTFDPQDDEALEVLLLELLTDEDKRDELAGRGLDRIKLFSWEKTSRATLEVYKKALS